MSEEVYSKFCEAVALQIGNSANDADECLAHLKQSLIWTSEASKNGEHADCDILLKGIYGAAVEAVTLTSFGLVRPAILSLRSHYELSLMFLYYKDHPVEWQNVLEYRARPILPGEVKKYLRTNFSNFEDRWKSLNSVRERKDEECYTVLSGVAHGTAVNSIPTATIPIELIEPHETIEQSIGIYLAVGESVNDIFISCLEGSWTSLSDDAKSALTVRFVGKNPGNELNL